MGKIKDVFGLYGQAPLVLCGRVCSGRGKKTDKREKKREEKKRAKYPALASQLD